MPDVSHEFDLHILRQLEKFFKDGELETLVRPPSFISGELPDLSKGNMGVAVKHLPTGKLATCEEYSTQIRNKACCLLTLLLDTPRRS
jgi:hypothetical protein